MQMIKRCKRYNFKEILVCTDDEKISISVLVSRFFKTDVLIFADQKLITPVAIDDRVIL